MSMNALWEEVAVASDVKINMEVSLAVVPTVLSEPEMGKCIHCKVFFYPKYFGLFLYILPNKNVYIQSLHRRKIWIPTENSQLRWIRRRIRRFRWIPTTD